MREPQYETAEIHVSGREEPIAYIRTCLHANTEPVETGGETVAHLCLDCDAQLPEWFA